MGYRLPLDSLPWAAPGRPRDRCSSAIPLARAAAAAPAGAAARRSAAARWRRAKRLRRPRAPRATPAARASRPAASSAPRCASSRATASLHVFMPPRRAARGLPRPGRRRRGHRRGAGHAGALEGYTPPSDPRLAAASQVTPDPGVIEVNIHPALQLGRAGATTPRSSTRRRARRRLGTEKFMLDGRHTGTGGGNHVVLGGADAGRQPAPAPARPAAQPARLLAQSPVAVVPVLRPVRRPDQPGAAHRRGAPRQPVRARDRLRRDAAAGDRRRAAVAGRSRVPPPAGRRHRQHAPRRVLHRQALQPGQRQRAARAWSSCARSRCRPHARMSLAQQLLMRGAGGAGSGASRTSAAGALGHRAARPLHAAALRRRGLRRRAAATCGAPASRSTPTGSRRTSSSASRCSARSTLSGLELELRQAIEPWHVLGEETRGGGTARYVDSSVERLQVKVQRHDRHAARGHLQRPARAAAPDRHAPASTWPACATAPGSRRLRCTRPSRVHAPLVFDVLDTWSERSLGGCTYHVAHPGGPSYETLPAQRPRGREPARARASSLRPHARAADALPPPERSAGASR